jgi:hypothetical protein
MALFRLGYRKSGQRSVAIIEAPSLMHSRMRAALDGLDDGARFVILPGFPGPSPEMLEKMYGRRIER